MRATVFGASAASRGSTVSPMAQGCRRRRGRWWHRVLADAVALVVVALVVAWLYWRPLLEPGTWLPSNGGDLASLIYPNYRFAAESLRRGDLPLWNPYIQSGAPFAADIQSGLLYPVNLVVFQLAPAVGYRLVMGLALAHTWLAGATAYAAGRGLGQRRPGALFAGVAYALSDFFVVHVGNLNLIAVAAWLPLVVLGGYRAAAGGGLRWIGLGAFGVAMATLAGHVQPLLYGLAALAFVAIPFAWPIARRGRWRWHWRPIAAVAAIAGVGLLAAAAQLIPAAELTRLSVRAEIPYDKSTEYSLPPEQLVSLLVPGFFGRGPDAYWGQWLRTEAGYAGVLTLLLAVGALVLRRTRLVGALALLALGGLLLALGGYTAVHGLVYGFLPVFGSLRAPARAVVVFDLGLALLAGEALSRLVGPLGRPARAELSRYVGWSARALTFVLVLAPPGLVALMLLRDNPALPRATGVVEGWLMLAFWLGGGVLLIWARRWHRLAPATLGALAVGWLALDLVTNAQGLEITHRDPAAGFERPTVVDFLRQDPEPFRIDTDTNVWDVWQPNTAMVQRIPDVVGGIHPLEVADFRRYWSELGSRSTRLYDLMNAKYVIVKKNTPLDTDKFKLAFDGDPVLSVYRNERALPRVQLVGRSVAAQDHEQADALIHAAGFDPARQVVVEGGETLSGDGGGSARLAEYRNDALAVEVAPSAPSYLVLSEVWYPGWTATVDGRPAPVLRADYLFRAVRVQPGDRRVELRFEPTSWRLALALSALGWLAIALLLLAPSRRPRLVR